MAKPKLDKSLSIQNFKAYYWLKVELVTYCKNIGLASSGGKIEIVKRILKYLETGEVINQSVQTKQKPQSKFDWSKEKLSNKTLITDNYTNTENVRAFFTEAISKKFKFNVAFMQWMKNHAGETLGDAIEQWGKIVLQKKDKNYKTEIAPQFEYNTYIRDFLEDNPQLSTKDAINSWKIKREQAGSKKYRKKDLDWLFESK